MDFDTRECDVSKLGRIVSMEEMRRIQIGILDELVSFCEENGLTYYLSGGTLLGAVRHKGYIPWDDDIDVNMPRPDCERLLALSGSRLGEHLKILSPFGPVPHTMAFLRICDDRYILKSESKDGKSAYYTRLYIDILPVEGLPTKEKEMRRHYMKARAYAAMRRLAVMECLPGKLTPRKIAHYALRPLAKLFGYKFWNKRHLNLALKYDYEKSDYVGVVTCCIHTVEEYIEKEGYGTPIKVEFEGKLYNAPANTHKYLTNLYGNYMQMPPAEKQVSHHTFTVYESK